MIVYKMPSGMYQVFMEQAELDFSHTALCYSMRLLLEEGNEEATGVARKINEARKTMEGHCRMKPEMEEFCKDMNNVFK